MESIIVDTLSHIGSALGIPAVIIAVWVIFELRTLKEKVRAMEDKNTTLEANLADIKADLAFIRGKMEGKL